MQTTTTLRHRKEQVQKAEDEHQEAVGILEGAKEALDVLHLYLSFTDNRKFLPLLRSTVQFEFRASKSSYQSNRSKQR